MNSPVTSLVPHVKSWSEHAITPCQSSQSRFQNATWNQDLRRKKILQTFFERIVRDSRGQWIRIRGMGPFYKSTASQKDKRWWKDLREQRQAPNKLKLAQTEAKEQINVTTIYTWHNSPLEGHISLYILNKTLCSSLLFFLLEPFEILLIPQILPENFVKQFSSSSDRHERLWEFYKAVERTTVTCDWQLFPIHFKWENNKKQKKKTHAIKYGSTSVEWRRFQPTKTKLINYGFIWNNKLCFCNIKDQSTTSVSLYDNTAWIKYQVPQNC